MFGAFIFVTAPNISFNSRAAMTVYLIFAVASVALIHQMNWWYLCGVCVCVEVCLHVCKDFVKISLFDPLFALFGTPHGGIVVFIFSVHFGCNVF